MLREGEVRIPSGCAIAAIIDRKGEPINGSEKAYAKLVIKFINTETV